MDSKNFTVHETTRMLQFIPEPVTTFRADVSALFGKYLPRNQVLCELVGRIGHHDAVDATDKNLSRWTKISNRIKREVVYLSTWFSHLMKANQKNCDLIQVRDMVSIGFLTLCIARLKGIRFCYWVSFLMCEQRIDRAHRLINEKASLKNYFILLKGKTESMLLYRFVLPYADHVFVQSDALADYYMTRGIGADKMTAVPMGVDMEQFSLSDLKGEKPEDWGTAPVIAYLGTLVTERKLVRLIDALLLVRQHVPNTRLLLIGSSEQKRDNDELLDHAKKVGLEGAVKITGWLPSREAWQLLLNADVAVSYFPRSLIYDVCTPTKCLEYLAAGMPCVGNDNPDQVQVLGQSHAGWLVSSDIADMAAALVEILQNPEVAAERAALGPAYIESHRSYRVIAEMVANEYRRIVQAHGKTIAASQAQCGQHE